VRALVVLDERWNSALTDLGIKVGLSLTCEVAFAVLKGKPAHERLKGKGYPLYFIEDPRKGLPFKAFFSLKRALTHFNPHAVITIRGDELLFAALLKNSLNYSLYRIHGSQRGVKDSFLNRLLHKKFVDGVIVSSRRLINPVVEGLRKLIVPGLVDSEEFYPDGEGAEEFRRRLGVGRKKLIGVVGRLDPVKGHDLFLRALSLLKRDDWVAVVAGEEKNAKLSELRSLARDLGISERVTFILERLKRVRALMSACDLGVVPSKGSEVILRAPLEFMACGTPVVSTGVGALPEVVKPPYGLSVPPAPESLASAIDSFLDKDLKKLGQVAREVAVENYSLKANAPLIDSFICRRV